MEEGSQSSGDYLVEEDKIMFRVIDLSIKEEKTVYQEIISSQEFHNPYYHIEYLQQHLNNSNRLVVFLLMEKEKCTAILPAVLNPISNTDFWDSTSPYGYSGPLFKDPKDYQQAPLLWEKVDQWYSENNIVTEFVRFSLNNNHIGYSGNCAKTLNNVCGNLKDTFELQWGAFGKKVRNNYRKAQTFEINFKLFDEKTLNEKIIDEFYGIYFKTMQRNNASKFLFFSVEFFYQFILNHKKDFTIGMVYLNGTPISTELHIHYKDTVYAFLGGADSDFFHTRPTDYLRVEVIKWAIQNEKKKYILGGGIVNDDGLYKSKKAFFPKDEDSIFYTGRKVVNKKLYNDLIKQTLDKKPELKNDNYFPLYRKP
ncbi:MAG: GNAT family N-acetyltransferase [Muricauda sp.]|nr:GNAT family N-acetyltransferase [Allomuricauda sp.]MBO6531953.1 GNAT family N-acetyltransferase [Allomuricauda sp.]MBO6590555.1 GNAT family N-acetyltransferase [Allomuricauda sp.]MBO6620133.1 GNAT family N-acetyltransferase [Allomuricauda sp.]MBO6646076.1 GNAT family N-acetyltransferase [Allomuricauda sp.]MBO6748519.1 GNAT family N-acetyltransferase [Allomuricauda sp.]